MLRENLVAGINEALGTSAITDVRFRVKRIPPRSISEPQAARPARTLSEEDKQVVAALAARLGVEPGEHISGLAGRMMARPDRSAVCPDCGGPMDSTSARCPFCTTLPAV